MWFLILCGSVLISEITALAIEKLYTIYIDELSFPEKLGQFKIFRRLILNLTLLASYFMTVVYENQALAILKIALVFLFMVIIITDFEQRMIFNVVLILIFGLSILFLWYMKLNFVEHFLIGGVVGAIFLIISVIFKHSIAGGDIKLIFICGFLFGINGIEIILTGAIFAGVAAILFLMTGIKKRTDYFAYGPYFSAAAIIKILI